MELSTYYRALKILCPPPAPELTAEAAKGDGTPAPEKSEFRPGLS